MAAEQPAPYVFPFESGARLIELGGGNNPRVRPNVDFRPGPQVDLVADLNKPLPIESGKWDGIISIYALEHVAWRNVRVTIGEMHRILRPGGIAACIVPNLYEQAKRLIVDDDWTDMQPCMIFGDNDYPENTHRMGWSPKSAERLFREAGFFKVKVSPLPGCATDMVIEATKSRVVIATKLP